METFTLIYCPLVLQAGILLMGWLDRLTIILNKQPCFLMWRLRNLLPSNGV